MPLLVLHPADPGAAPPRREVVELLARLGLVAAPPAADGAFAPGPAFMELITFLGCSPAPVTGGPGACAVRVPPVAPAPLLRTGSNTPAPRCPRCRAAVAHWQPLARAWAADALAAAWRCPACGTRAAAAALDWRNGAGVARAFIDVHGVYPAEAVPGDILLDALAALSGGPWRWFYLRDGRA